MDYAWESASDGLLSCCCAGGAAAARRGGSGAAVEPERVHLQRWITATPATRSLLQERAVVPKATGLVPQG